MQTYDTYHVPHQEAADSHNLLWSLSEIFNAEVKIALGRVQRGGAGGGIGAVDNGLYGAEIMTSHELVDQITHLDTLIQQADLIIFGEGVNDADQILETTTVRLAELA